MRTDDHVGVTVRLQKKAVLRGGHITNGSVAVEGVAPSPPLTPVPPILIAIRELKGTCNVSASGVGADHAGAAGGIKNTAIESITRQVSLTSVVGIAIATCKL
jgi:hypothetical protein